MTALKNIAVAVTLSALAIPSGAMAAVVLGDRVYPEHMRAELRSACQGLDMKSRESLTSEWNDEEESGDPASDYYLSFVSFTLRDCKEAGLI